MHTNSFTYFFIGLASMFLVSFASARDLKSDKFNYVITIPDGWSITSQNPDGCTIATPDAKKSMSLSVVEVGPGELDSQSIARIERDMLKSGTTEISSRYFTVDGVRAFETIRRFGQAPSGISYITHLIIADGKLYNLQAMNIAGDVSQDADIQEALASFHFLHPPKAEAHSLFGVKLAIVAIIIVGFIYWMVRRRAA